MRFRAKLMSVCGSLFVAGAFALVPGQSGMTANAAQPADEPSAPSAQVTGVARALGISTAEAKLRLVQQDEAHEVYKRLPRALVKELAGHWFDANTGELTVAVTSDADAAKARAAGARATVVQRSDAELDRLVGLVRERAGSHIPGLSGFGVDVRRNDVLVRVARTSRTAATRTFLREVRALDGVRVAEVHSVPVQQAGEVNPGDAWWPGSESPCSVGFGATDTSGGKHFVTAGHCTNDANQPAYGEQNQQNKLGTSNVGGSRSVNAREGDMGVVAVTDPGWSLSASVNTWGQPAVTVTGSAEAMVGEAVCHSGKTAPNWECGEVTKVDQSIDYGHIVEGLTISTACSQGGDSGGAWLRGDKAVGLHSGGVNGNSCPAGDNGIFQPVNESLTKWGLTLHTGGGGGGDTEAPTAPGNLRSTGSTSSSVSLAWDASTDNVGVTRYNVYNGAALATTVTGTAATVSGLTPDTDYTFTVTAEDAAGNKSPAGNKVAARTAPGDPGGGGERTFRNDTDYQISDFRLTTSQVRSTASGAAANPVTVNISATHTCQQDLQIGVMSPTGRYYQLQRYGYDNWQCTPFPGTRSFTFAPVNEGATGTWTLRIGDNGSGDVGVLGSWSITL